MKDFDVLVVGELNVDIILDNIKAFPEIGKEIIAEDLTVTLGSSSAIFASNLSSLEINVAFLGKIGNDSFANLINETLIRKNVNTDFVITSPQYKTGLTIVMNYDMDRANVTFPGAMDYLGEDEVTDKVLSKAKHLHVSSVFLQKKLKKDIVKLFQRAKKMGLSTSMDPQWDPEEKWELSLAELLPYIDVFLPNATEFKHLTNCTDIKSGIEKVKRYANTIVIKDGEHGAHLWEQGELTSKPAFLNTHVADCIGAGDSFDAGFISEYIKGKPNLYCLEIGNITGAINTTASGGTTAFKNFETIKDIAKSKFSYHF
ncbi:carbohydrate kinase family protein [Aquimarina pacifica]|uniref:carbohydrate kinase family protein n=1 Tax=Aquimarina pacifica TaxID=1296415 RepID=UPI00046EAC44|nr:carbohydrate kinase family protein [Aquimarina pacifica]